MKFWQKVLIKVTLNGITTGGITFFSTSIALGNASLKAAMFGAIMACGFSFFLSLREAIDKYFKINGGSSFGENKLKTKKLPGKKRKQMKLKFIHDITHVCKLNCNEKLTLKKDILFF